MYILTEHTDILHYTLLLDVAAGGNLYRETERLLVVKIPWLQRQLLVLMLGKLQGSACSVSYNVRVWLQGLFFHFARHHAERTLLLETVLVRDVVVVLVGKGRTVAARRSTRCLFVVVARTIVGLSGEIHDVVPDVTFDAVLAVSEGGGGKRGR